MDEESFGGRRLSSGGNARSVSRLPYRAYGRRGVPERNDDEISGLDFSMQGLKLIAPRITSWVGLTTLNLSCNAITEIPAEIARLTSLAVLDLSHNKITRVPKELGRLYNLKDLRLGSNLISSVPAEFGMLFQVEKLDLDGNPLVGQIQAVYSTSGGLGVIRYCRDNVALNVPYWEREWVFNDAEENSTAALNDTITVATYNILCPTYTGGQAFAYVPAWALQWDARKTTILQEATSYGADILCIQEMDTASYLDFFKDQFKARGDYEAVFYQKTRAKTMSEFEKRTVDGCAIFWKLMTFQLVEQKCIHLSQLFASKMAAENEHIATRVMGRDNIALVVVLERSGGHIVVANAHIHWDPEYPDVKTLQGVMLLKEVDAIMSRYPGAELVICGDFNSLPSSSLYELLSTGQLRPNSKDLLGLPYEPYSSKGYTNSLSLSNSYSFVNMGFTNFTPAFMGVIDYIWHNDKLQPLCSLGAIDDEYVSKIVGLPTHHYPSDHLILVTQFRCKHGTWKGTLNK
ncbi:CCR4-NOT transcription complex subunit 6 [Nematocida displodere]|uniref:poly(A)-specific ribonuclease n=1 Tax=Nematocida displodere TaxID=1805483 RepID=A0A177EIH0_9MICR|nr:CCR4-NOT transcription complex subunit 6 [Nematocida displodere]